jgi:hypothetical protein
VLLRWVACQVRMPSPCFSTRVTKSLIGCRRGHVAPEHAPQVFGAIAGVLVGEGREIFPPAPGPGSGQLCGGRITRCRGACCFTERLAPLVSQSQRVCVSSGQMVSSVRWHGVDGLAERGDQGETVKGHRLCSAGTG